MAVILLVGPTTDRRPLEQVMRVWGHEDGPLLGIVSTSLALRKARDMASLIPHLSPDILKSLLEDGSSPFDLLSLQPDEVETMSPLMDLIEQTYHHVVVTIDETQLEAMRLWLCRAERVVQWLASASDASPHLSPLIEFLIRLDFPRRHISFLCARDPGPFTIKAIEERWDIPSFSSRPQTSVSPKPIAQVHEQSLVARVVSLLQAKMDQERHRFVDLPRDRAAARARLKPIISDLISRLDPMELAATDRTTLISRVLDAAVGLGPLETLLADPAITEIMVNGMANIYVERAGKIERSADHFSNDAELRAVIERIVAPIGSRIDESSPYVDARLCDGSRVNIVLPPLALNGPTVTIRRFDQRLRGMNELVESGMLSTPLADLLLNCVRSRLSIVVSGGTGSGKTTFLNALAQAIGDEERVITIEDAAELQLNTSHVVRLEARPPNLEGAGEVTIRDLVRNSHRMRPDRIIVGECRGPEALDMLQAMNTGHEGSLTTVHANSSRDAIRRLEMMVLFASGDLPLRVIREQIVAAIDLVVQLSRFPRGDRQVVEIEEVVGLEGDVVTMQPLMTSRTDVAAPFHVSTLLPHCASRLADGRRT